VVTFSNKHNRKWQYPNLQHKKVYWAEGQRWVKLRICTKAIKTIEKKGLDAMAKEAGIDLWKLPFEDARPERLAYLEANKGVVPVVSPWGGRRGRGAVEAQRQGQGQGHDPRAGGSGWGGGGAEQALCHSRCACGGAAEHARRVQAATAAGRAIA
jgi:large subunit ribosomal protein L28